MFCAVDRTTLDRFQLEIEHCILFFIFVATPYVRLTKVHLILMFTKRAFRGTFVFFCVKTQAAAVQVSQRLRIGVDDTCDLAPVEHACDDTGPMVPAAGEVLVSVCDYLYLLHERCF